MPAAPHVSRGCQASRRQSQARGATPTTEIQSTAPAAARTLATARAVTRRPPPSQQPSLPRLPAQSLRHAPPWSCPICPYPAAVSRSLRSQPPAASGRPRPASSKAGQAGANHAQAACAAGPHTNTSRPRRALNRYNSGGAAENGFPAGSRPPDAREAAAADWKPRRPAKPRRQPCQPIHQRRQTSKRHSAPAGAARSTPRHASTADGAQPGYADRARYPPTPAHTNQTARKHHRTAGPDREAATHSATNSQHPRV